METPSMLQNFDDLGGPQHGAARLGQLREELQRRNLTGFLTPRADEYQNEYVPACAERLLWLTGFSGSWGFAAVLPNAAALFVDGRYTLQARAQVDQTAFTTIVPPEPTSQQWLAENLTSSDRIGYDPWLLTIDSVENLVKIAENAGATLVPVEDNPLDALWTAPDRPSAPFAPIEPHPEALSGCAASAKLSDIQTMLSAKKLDAVIITALDSIAWLFNIRGGDTPHTPVVLARAIVPAEGQAQLFVDGRKAGPEVRTHLEGVATLHESEALGEALAELGRANARVRLDPKHTPQWFADQLTAAGAKIVRGEDPCILPKARKNAAEIEGARSAHIRDGVAICRFLAWMDAHAEDGDLDEINAAERLEAFRREAPTLREISFDSISASGPNGAIVHYRVTRSTNRRIKPGELYLIDSGGQYIDGTTDITRTVAIGAPTAEMRRHYTLVLKGHVAIAMARFPAGTRGCDLDVLARAALWQAGLDFDHGTGHGVGSYLSVHEGPQGISKRSSAALEPGMILSNEPGYYSEGAYGIRIENLVLVAEPETIAGGTRPMMGFETLTLAPYDMRLIDLSLLTLAERAWINAYHARVAATLTPLLDAKTRDWLTRACTNLDFAHKSTAAPHTDTTHKVI
ncbi:MAG: aminopeptidase P family protein [Alphaproteobacteria bacterium]